MRSEFKMRFRGELYIATALCFMPFVFGSRNPIAISGDQNENSTTS